MHFFVVTNCFAFGTNIKALSHMLISRNTNDRKGFIIYNMYEQKLENDVEVYEKWRLIMVKQQKS